MRIILLINLLFDIRNSEDFNQCIQSLMLIIDIVLVSTLEIDIYLLVCVCRNKYNVLVCSVVIGTQ